MRSLPRLLLASASVVIILVVATTGVVLGPDDLGGWLLLATLAAAVTALQSVASDPADLTIALVFTLVPVLALLAEGSPSWLVGPLGALLLLAGELGALSWECQGEAPLTAVARRRLRSSAGLASLGLAAALAIGVVAAGPAIDGTAAVALAAAGLATLGAVLFRGTG